MRQNPEVSVIIVHYGASKEAFKCVKGLESIRRNSKSTEYIFIDNDEVKITGEKIHKKYPWIKYIPSPVNLGFGGGRNLGRKYAKGKYILSLDSDIVIEYESFRKLVNFIKNHKKTGLVSPKLVNISGKPTPQATSELTPLKGIFWLSFINKIWPGNPVTKKYMMSQWDRSDTRQVDVGQLGGFIIRKDAFDQVGGFDEKMFLYFEENDLAKNLQNAGWKIFYYPDSYVTHLESKGTPKSSDRIKSVFAHSRFRYFSKHYGYFKAGMVEMFARSSVNTLILIAILLTASFLRFYRINQNLVFHGEVGYDYLAVREMIAGERTPLLGPRTSHEWLSLSPLFYWIFAIILPLGNYHPVIGAYFFAFIGVVTVLICYIFVKKYFGVKTALIAGFLMSISPSWVELTRNARFNSLAALLFFPYFHFLIKSIEEGGKYLFWLGLMIGLMYNFFATSIILVIVSAMVLFLKHVHLKKNEWMMAILGLAIPNTTFIIYNLTTGFGMLSKLLVWIPYRIAGFIGLYPKNTVSVNSVQSNFTAFYTFFRESFIQFDTQLFLLIFIIIALYLVKEFIKRLSVNKSVFWFCLASVLIFTYAGFFILGDAPRHYYYVIFPIPIILFAYFLESTLKRKFGILIVLILVSGFVYTNMKYYFSGQWFYQPEDSISKKTYLVPFLLQEKIVDYIYNDAQGGNFELKRVGMWDDFESDFSQNYIYLLERLGNKPVTDAKLVYTIYEDTSTLGINSKYVWIGDVAVKKEVK